MPDVQHTRVLEIDGCFHGKIKSVQPRLHSYRLHSSGDLWSAANQLRSAASNAKTISSSATADLDSRYVLLMEWYPEAGESGKKGCRGILELARRWQLTSRLPGGLKHRRDLSNS